MRDDQIKAFHRKEEVTVHDAYVLILKERTTIRVEAGYMECETGGIEAGKSGTGRQFSWAKSLKGITFKKVDS